jgi:hypothetical protein
MKNCSCQHFQGKEIAVSNTLMIKISVEKCQKQHFSLVVVD